MWSTKLILILLLYLTTSCVHCICDEDDKKAAKATAEKIIGEDDSRNLDPQDPTEPAPSNRVPMPAFLSQLNSTSTKNRGQVKIFERGSKERSSFFNSREGMTRKVDIRAPTTTAESPTTTIVTYEEKEKKVKEKEKVPRFFPPREMIRKVDIKAPPTTLEPELEEVVSVEATQTVPILSDEPVDIIKEVDEDNIFDDEEAREGRDQDDQQSAATGSLIGKMLSLKSSLKSAKFKQSPYYRKPIYRPPSVRPNVVIPPSTIRTTTTEPEFVDNGDEDLVPLFPGDGGGGGGGDGIDVGDIGGDGGGGGGSATATVVPILGGGARSLDDNLNDYGESVTEIIFPSQLSARLGRKNTRLPIRRVVGGGGGKPTKATGLRTQEIEFNDPDIIKDFVFSDIKCFRTRNKEYFGAKIHLQTKTMPYIRDRPSDPLTSSNCKMESLGASAYQMSLSDLRGCGVEMCGDQQMCLTMVFPKVSTLALADDEVTTIRCTPQKSTMSEIRTISFSGDSLENRKSGSTVTGGKQDFAAEVGVFRQSPGTNNGLYSKRVNSGGVVKLGEDLQLRSVVRGGDGWAHSKLTDVKVWRMRDGYRHTFDTLNPGDASEVITLVDARGCRNSDYKVIAGDHPLRDPRNDLVHHFTFKAFLFRGQRSNEPLIVTAKVQACQDEDGCVDECDEGSSRDKREDSPRHRRDLPTEVKNISSIIHDWNSYVALRVVGPNEHEPAAEDNSYYYERRPSCVGQMVGAGFIGCFVMLICCTIGLAGAVLCKRKGQRRQGFAFFRNNINANGGYMNAMGVGRNPNGNPSSRPPSRRNGNNGSPNSGASGPTRDQNSNNVGNSNGNGNDNDNDARKSSPPKPANRSSKQKPLPPIPPASGNKGSQDNEDEYESIPDKDFYIVYYCDKRSTSAPASLRMKRVANRDGIASGEDDNDNRQDGEEEEEDSSDQIEPIIRRTVRSLKQRSRKRNRYRKGGSLKLAQKITTDENTSSDSAYSGSSSATSGNVRSIPGRLKAINGTPSYRNNTRSCSSSRSPDDPVPPLPVSTSNDNDNVNDLFGWKHNQNVSRSKPSLSSTISNGNGNGNESASATQMTHFVTRNDSSTQIIIIPETNL